MQEGPHSPRSYVLVGVDNSKLRSKARVGAQVLQQLCVDPLSIANEILEENHVYVLEMIPKATELIRELDDLGVEKLLWDTDSWRKIITLTALRLCFQRSLEIIDGFVTVVNDLRVKRIDDVYRISKHHDDLGVGVVLENVSSRVLRVHV